MDVEADEPVGAGKDRPARRRDEFLAARERQCDDSEAAQQTECGAPPQEERDEAAPNAGDGDAPAT
ncbi:hypothetical protein [Kitasatospora arboriphila]